MRILLFFVFLASLSHAEEEGSAKDFLSVFSKSIKQQGVLVLTPTDETNNDVETVYADTALSIEKGSFRVEVNFKQKSKRILFSYDVKNGYKESWFDGKKNEPFQSSNVSDFYSSLFLKNPKVIEAIFEVKRVAIVDDDSKLEAYRYELVPRGDSLPKVVFVLAPKSDKIYMFSLAYRGQSFVWRDSDENP